MYLLEQAVWSCNNIEPTQDLDAEVFRRWVLEGGTEAAIQSVKRAKSASHDRVAINSALVFGRDERQRSKL